MRTVLAVDLGGTKTAIARVDEEGTLVDHQKLPAAPSLDESVDQVAAAWTSHRDADAVGVIVPGIFTPATGQAWCPNLWGPDEVPLRRALRDRLDIAVAIDSDRSGYVLGEAWLGAARGLRDVIFVAIGTGVGVGLLVDGRLVRGAHGIAGAAGWFALTPVWRDGYGQTGCWEAESAGPALAARLDAPDAAHVVSQARGGDAAALDALRRAAQYTGMGVANLISALDPEMVVLGGGLLQGAGDLVLDAIRKEARRWAQPIAASRCRIELTHLGEHAGLLGAARLALDCR